MLDDLFLVIMLDDLLYYAVPPLVKPGLLNFRLGLSDLIQNLPNLQLYSFYSDYEFGFVLPTSGCCYLGWFDPLLEEFHLGGCPTLRDDASPRSIQEKFIWLIDPCSGSVSLCSNSSPSDLSKRSSSGYRWHASTGYFPPHEARSCSPLVSKPTSVEDQDGVKNSSSGLCSCSLIK
jgi:hypothetical protein